MLSPSKRRAPRRQPPRTSPLAFIALIILGAWGTLYFSRMTPPAKDTVTEGDEVGPAEEKASRTLTEPQ